jgi:glycosyltransferase involved in cell wall biosynthesis
VDGVDIVRIPTRGVPRLSVAARLNDEFHRGALSARLTECALAFRPDVVHAHHTFHFGIPAIEQLARIAPLLLTATDFSLVCPYATLALTSGATCGGPAADLHNCVDHHRARPADNGIKRPAGLLALAERAAATMADLAGLDKPNAIRSAVWARLEACRRLSATACRVLATSERIRSQLMAAGVDADRVLVLRHEAPPLVVPPVPIGDPLRIGFLGVLRSHKGAHVLVEAVRRLPADVRCAAIIRGDVAVDPPYVAELRRRASGDRRIRIVDRVPYPRFGDALAEIDVLVVPSIWTENAPIVLLSALAAGRYVVVSDVAGLADHVDRHRNGRVFPSGNVAALAEVLLELLRDPAPVVEARKHASGFDSFTRYLDRLERLYAGAALKAGTAVKSPGLIA